MCAHTASTHGLPSEMNGAPFSVTHQSIKHFARAVMDFNPLHFDEQFMTETQFGATRFDGVIMHGQTGYGLVTRMLTDWAAGNDAEVRRVELRFLKPVHPGDVITPAARLKAVQETTLSHWAVFDVSIQNQDGVITASGEAQLELYEPGAA